jgi:VWFA-related protein
MLFPEGHAHSQANWQLPVLLALAVLPGRPLNGVEPKGETVSIYLNVEKNDAFVTGLNQGNFMLYEEGQTLPFPLNTPEVPAYVALLVEHSQSSVLYVEEIEAAVQAFLKHAPEHNWYQLATYDRNLSIRADFTQHTGKLREAFLQVDSPMWNEVSTYDSIYEILDKLGRLPGRRVLIVVGSGVDTSSEHSLDEVRQKIEAENVTVFAAGLSSVLQMMLDPYLESSGRLTLFQAQAFLQMLADKSGGFARFPNHVDTFDDVMKGILRSIRMQYRIVYERKARRSCQFQKLKVEAFDIVNGKREDFKVFVREGWR